MYTENNTHSLFWKLYNFLSILHTYS